MIVQQDIVDPLAMNQYVPVDAMLMEIVCHLVTVSVPIQLFGLEMLVIFLLVLQSVHNTIMVIVPFQTHVFVMKDGLIPVTIVRQLCALVLSVCQAMVCVHYQKHVSVTRNGQDHHVIQPFVVQVVLMDNALVLITVIVLLFGLELLVMFLFVLQNVHNTTMVVAVLPIYVFAVRDGLIQITIVRQLCVILLASMDNVTYQTHVLVSLDGLDQRVKHKEMVIVNL